MRAFRPSIPGTRSPMSSLFKRRHLAFQKISSDPRYYNFLLNRQKNLLHVCSELTWNQQTAHSLQRSRSLWAQRCKHNTAQKTIFQLLWYVTIQPIKTFKRKHWGRICSDQSRHISHYFQERTFATKKSAERTELSVPFSARSVKTLSSLFHLPFPGYSFTFLYVYTTEIKNHQGLF